MQVPWDSAAVFVREVSCLTIPCTNKMLPISPVVGVNACKPQQKPKEAAANVSLEVMCFPKCQQLFYLYYCNDQCRMYLRMSLPPMTPMTPPTNWNACLAIPPQAGEWRLQHLLLHSSLPLLSGLCPLSLRKRRPRRRYPLLTLSVFRYFTKGGF